MTKSVYGRVFRREGRPGFYIRVRGNGRETERYAGPDRTTAHEVLAQLLQVHRRHQLLGEKPIQSVAIEAVIFDFDSFLKAKHAAKTYEVERQRLDDVAQHFQGVPLCEVDPGMITDFLTDRRINRGLSAATVNRYQSLLSLLFKFALDRGMARSNPVAGLRRAKEDLRPVDFISDADVTRLVAGAGDPVFAVLIRVLADTGLRRSEALALAWRDVNLERGELLVRLSKTHRPRTVPLTPLVAAALQAHRDRAPSIPFRGTDPVFPTLQSINPSSVSCRFQTVAKRAGLSMRLHDLRHGFCSRLAQAGVPLPTVAALAGHRAIQTTMRYSRHLPESAGRDAIAKLAAGRRSKKAASA